MTPEKFNEIFAARVKHITELAGTKGIEYSRQGDRLWNFRAAATMSGNTDFESLWGMWVKHIVSIKDMVDDAAAGNLPSRKTIDEKISDNMIYSILFEGLIEDARPVDLISVDLPIGPQFAVIAGGVARKCTNCTLPNVLPTTRTINNMYAIYCPECGTATKFNADILASITQWNEL